MSRRQSITKSLSSRFFSSSSSLVDVHDEKKDDDAEEEESPTFLTSPLGPKVATILDSHGDKIHDDSFLKIVRQLEFWYPQLVKDDDDADGSSGGEKEFLELAERLAKIASWREELIDDIVSDGSSSFQIPTVRFGKTELQM